ncbi:MAG: HNH endonuclease [Atopobiaceae bacterium]|nr:HNH endonuclease [Atopobiaceae bacterium]
MPSSNPRYRNPKRRHTMRVRIMRRGDPCALCGKPIDYSLPRGHPMAYELDEIIPISRGGSPIDPDNLQATHAICNRRKGNKLPDEQLRVIERPMPTSRDWWE